MIKSNVQLAMKDWDMQSQMIQSNMHLIWIVITNEVTVYAITNDEISAQVFSWAPTILAK